MAKFMKKSYDMYFNTYIMVKNPNPEPDEDDMMELEVEAHCSCLPGHPGSYWDPPEGPEISLEELCTLDGKKIDLNTLTSKEINRIEDEAAEKAADGYFD